VTKAAKVKAKEKTAADTTEASVEKFFSDIEQEKADTEQAERLAVEEAHRAEQAAMTMTWERSYLGKVWPTDKVKKTLADARWDGTRYFDETQRALAFRKDMDAVESVQEAQAEVAKIGGRIDEIDGKLVELQALRKTVWHQQEDARAKVQGVSEARARLEKAKLLDPIPPAAKIVGIHSVTVESCHLREGDVGKQWGVATLSVRKLQADGTPTPGCRTNRFKMVIRSSAVMRDSDDHNWKSIGRHARACLLKMETFPNGIGDEHYLEFSDQQRLRCEEHPPPRKFLLDFGDGKVV